MKSKKGIFMKFTLEVVVAVVCIMFLTFAGYRVAEAYIGDRELNKAEDYAVKLEKIIANLIEGEEQSLMILGLMDWAVTGWPFNPGSFSEEVMPEKCWVNGWEKCICLCDDWKGWMESRSIDRLRRGEFKEWCDERSVCFEADNSKFNEVIVSVEEDGDNNEEPVWIQESAISIKMKLNNGELRIWKNEQES
ncbi:MAG: hypothetical protein ABIB47_02220 [Candidatus Woesearchaeota archaeon]